MAYVSQDDKKKLAPGIKAVLKKYDVKGSISVQHRMTLVVKLTGGTIAFNSVEEDYGVNQYWIDENYNGVKRAFLNELVAAMKGQDYFCHDDAQSDYFFRSHYIQIDVGSYDKPYKYTGCNIDKDLRLDPTQPAYIIEQSIAPNNVENIVF